jgi:hypothetical protein
LGIDSLADTAEFTGLDSAGLTAPSCETVEDEDVEVAPDEPAPPVGWAT